jgi:hypothetical protein
MVIVAIESHQGAIDMQVTTNPSDVLALGFFAPATGRSRPH